MVRSVRLPQGGRAPGRQGVSNFRWPAPHRVMTARLDTVSTTVLALGPWPFARRALPGGGTPPDQYLVPWRKR